MPVTLKDPIKVRAGTIGAAKRWHGHIPRAVRMDSLTPEEQDVVRALLRLRAARESTPAA